MIFPQIYLPAYGRPTFHKETYNTAVVMHHFWTICRVKIRKLQFPVRWLPSLHWRALLSTVTNDDFNFSVEGFPISLELFLSSKYLLTIWVGGDCPFTLLANKERTHYFTIITIQWSLISVLLPWEFAGDWPWFVGRAVTYQCTSMAN